MPRIVPPISDIDRIMLFETFVRVGLVHRREVLPSFIGEVSAFLCDQVSIEGKLIFGYDSKAMRLFAERDVAGHHTAAAEKAEAALEAEMHSAWENAKARGEDLAKLGFIGGKPPLIPTTEERHRLARVALEVAESETLRATLEASEREAAAIAPTFPAEIAARDALYEVRPRAVELEAKIFELLEATSAGLSDAERVEWLDRFGVNLHFAPDEIDPRPKPLNLFKQQKLPPLAPPCAPSVAYQRLDEIYYQPYPPADDAPDASH